MNPMLKEAYRLYQMGFAILWIKPKSKAPVRSRWTTGPRETWDELKSSFRPGYNMGVRLGTPSKLKTGYLSVIDIDVKSTDPKHRMEAEACVNEIFTLPKNPVKVLSGRGNGSSHIYIVTPHPAAPSKRKVSNDKVKVFMPSASINPSQREALSDEDLNEGWRIRPAWEVAVMGEGQQVLLPPSVHPDSNKNYIWERKLNQVEDLVQVELRRNKKELERTTTNDWQPVEVDLFNSSLPSAISDLIFTAECEDRSAAIFKVAIAMVKCFFTDQEIMTVLTDPQYELGLVSYEHAKTQSRTRAANWVFNYTIKKARQENDARLQFDEEVEEIPLTEEQAKAQAAELVAIPDWKNQLERSQAKGGGPGKIKASLRNLELILKHDVGENIFSRDLFNSRDVYGFDTPWGGKRGASISDTDLVLIKVWFANRFRFEPSVGLILEAVMSIAERNAFHPVRDYLNNLEWDGVARIDSWLKTYLQASGPEPYLSDVSRKILIAMVARAFVPGIKFDHIPVLEGNQGVGKSSAARILASDEWFADNLPDLKHADARLNLQGKWIVEMGELASLKKTELEQIKAYVTSSTDRVRAPYGRLAVDIKRQSIFIGTTNEDTYLKDQTGNRRFWPVKVGKCDFKGLQAARDQLFAEALFLWQSFGESLYLEGQSKLQAITVQAARTPEDEQTIMHDLMLEFIEQEQLKNGESRFNFNSFRVLSLFEDFGPFSDKKPTMHYLLIATKALKSLGFEKYTSMGKSKWRLSENEKPH